MNRFSLAVRAFFRTLGNQQVAARVADALSPATAAAPQLPAPDAKKPAPAAQREPAKPQRSDALTLLAALQREARFIDLVMEPLDAYSDAQIGSAARAVLRDSKAVLERLVAIAPAQSQPEGAEIEIPKDYDAGQFKLTGALAATPPSKGKLVHPGWRSAALQLPIWNGSAAAASIIAPAEVEVG